MDTAIEVHLELRIEPGAIAGSMSAPHRAPTAFVGWLGLIDAVVRLQTELAAVIDVQPEQQRDRIDDRIDSDDTQGETHD